MTNTTATLTSRFGTADILAEQADLTIEQSDSGYTIGFAAADAAIASIEKAKAKGWSAYLRAGGNPRNKRSYGSQFAAAKKAILAAA